MNKLGYMITKFHEFTDYQWVIFGKLLVIQEKRKHFLRTILNAIFWINNTGCQRRNLVAKQPLVSYFFSTLYDLKPHGIWGTISRQLGYFRTRNSKK